MQKTTKATEAAERLLRYTEECPDTTFTAVSGAVTDRSLRDFAMFSDPTEGADVTDYELGRVIDGPVAVLK